jgi:hypothetical protein
MEKHEINLSASGSTYHSSLDKERYLSPDIKSNETTPQKNDILQGLHSNEFLASTEFIINALGYFKSGTISTISYPTNYTGQTILLYEIGKSFLYHSHQNILLYNKKDNDEMLAELFYNIEHRKSNIARMVADFGSYYNFKIDEIEQFFNDNKNIISNYKVLIFDDCWINESDVNFFDKIKKLTEDFNLVTIFTYDIANISNYYYQNHIHEYIHKHIYMHNSLGNNTSSILVKDCNKTMIQKQFNLSTKKFT